MIASPEQQIGPCCETTTEANYIPSSQVRALTRRLLLAAIGKQKSKLAEVSVRFGVAVLLSNSNALNCKFGHEPPFDEPIAIANCYSEAEDLRILFEYPNAVLSLNNPYPTGKVIPNSGGMCGGATGMLGLIVHPARPESARSPPTSHDIGAPELLKTRRRPACRLPL